MEQYSMPKSILDHLTNYTKKVLLHGIFEETTKLEQNTTCDTKILKWLPNTINRCKKSQKHNIYTESEQMTMTFVWNKQANILNTGGTIGSKNT
jgi:TorA maturation chaperone TorD